MSGQPRGEALRLLQLHNPFQQVSEVTVAFTLALGMDGLALSLLSGGVDLEPVWCSDGATRRFEDLQSTLGQGPGRDAARTALVQWMPDWAQVRPDRWPAPTAQTPGLEARAVFCFPLAVGAVCVGVLTTVRRAPGPLARRQAADASVLAAALTARYLNSGTTQREQLALGGGPLLRDVVHQASGMVSAQLAISASEALLRLRALAFAFAFACGSGRPLGVICQEVVDRRLRLPRDVG